MLSFTPLTQSDNTTPSLSFYLLTQNCWYAVIFTAKYSREFSVWPVETKWHGTVLDLIIMLKSMFVLPQMLVDGS
jgi:hypothetical protein